MKRLGNLFSNPKYEREIGSEYGYIESQIFLGLTHKSHDRF
jgi:hypothetical protein